MSRTNPSAPSASQLDLVFEEPRSNRRVWPVSELVAQVRELVELEYADVWVEGEISNYRPAPSGHVYFTLKDAEAQLPTVFFRRQAMLLRFRPEDGLHVLVRGRPAPLAGRVSMDQISVDVTEIEGVRRGDEVVLIGRQGDEGLPATLVAEWLGTSPYEVVSEILARVPRVH